MTSNEHKANTKRKHIVIDARELRTSTGRYVERLLNYLMAIDDHHRYSVLLKPKDIDGWQPTNPNFTAVACPHREFSFDEQLGLMSQIHDLKPDLVHFAMVQQPVMFKDCPVVTTMHDLTTIRFNNPSKNPIVFKTKQQVYKWVNKRVAKKSAAVITPSQFVKDDVVRYCGIDPKKVTVTYESADNLPAPAEPIDDIDSPSHAVRVGAPFIMYVGRPTPHKNLERLVEAFKTLQADNPDLVLVLAGKQDDNYRRIEADVRRQSLPNVLFTDFISDQQLRWLYQNCSAYVFPSLSEGFGLPGLEAMVHGAPVVSSNATCLPEIYGEAAHYFDPLDTSDMAAKINAVIHDQTLRSRLVARGHEQAATYSWHRMAEQTLAIYCDVLGETHGK